MPFLNIRSQMGPHAENMELDFITLDVFTSTRYEGNPLAIVKIPAALKDLVTQEQKQTVAREFNLSETIFLHEKTEGKDEWKVDIFTTNDELPFAGHPTIGAACYILNINPMTTAGVVSLLTRAGSIEISNLNGGVSADIPHNVRIHRHTIGDLLDADIGLSSNNLLAEAEKAAPLVSIVKGMTFLLVALPSIELLAEAHNTSRHLSFFQLLDKGWEEGFVARYYYVLGPQGPKGLEVRCRMIEQTMEDPATGSAACALASYLTLTGKGVRLDGVGKFTVIQGVEMGRKSVIGVEVTLNEGGKRIKRVKLSGSAVKVMEGKVRI